MKRNPKVAKLFLLLCLPLFVAFSRADQIYNPGTSGGGGGVGGLSSVLAIDNNANALSITNLSNLLVSGNVGIGTTTPASPLSVYENNTSTATTIGATIEQDGTGDAALWFVLSSTERYVMGIDNSDGDKFKIQEASALGATPQFCIDPATDFVGIGTDTPATKLHVMNGSVGASVATSYDDLIVENTSNAGITIIGSTNAAMGDAVGLRFNNEASGAFGDMTLAYDYSLNRGILGMNRTAAELVFAVGGNSEAMRIDGDGNVGIGTFAPIWDAPRTKFQVVKTGAAKKVLVIGADVLSRMCGPDDRSTVILFGDGAGAVVIGVSDTPGIINTHIYADGSQGDLLKCSFPPRANESSEAVGYMTMKGNDVFKVAVTQLSNVVTETLRINNIDKSEIDWLVPHQANFRIINATAKKLNMSLDKVVLTLARHGNTSAASVPIALDEAVRDGRIQRGQLLLLEAFGAGFAWGSALVRF